MATVKYLTRSGTLRRMAGVADNAFALRALADELDEGYWNEITSIRKRKSLQKLLRECAEEIEELRAALKDMMEFSRCTDHAGLRLSVIHKCAEHVLTENDTPHSTLQAAQHRPQAAGRAQERRERIGEDRRVGQQAGRQDRYEH